MLTYLFSKATFKIVRSKKLRWMLSKNFPTIFFPPHMTIDEYQLFKKLCSDKKVFLEYGSGGSTIDLLKRGKTIFSVESNPDFYEYMSAIPLVKEAIGKNLDYRFIDLGPTNKWGKPLNLEHTDHWPEYYAGIWDRINPGKEKIDMIFIDGRFRVACCLYSILKVIEYDWKDTIIIIHDFWRREKYHVVLQFLVEIKSATNLASFKVKPGLNRAQVEQKMSVYALDIY